MFHRLSVPTYYGGLPSGYTYLNSPSLVGGTGAPAPIDGRKTGGPNDGTYLVAFGEDALSSNVNRGVSAVAESTDLLDDYLHRDVAVTVRTATVFTFAPIPSAILTGYAFVGEFGVPNNQETRDLLVSVLDANDDEIVTPAGVKVQVAQIVDNLVDNNNVVGVTTSGFYSNPNAVFNVPIPAGTSYHIYYGERSCLAELPQGAFTNIKIRGAQEVSADVERVLRNLHAATLQDWNSPWDATIRSLARSSLDGRYRRSVLDTYSGAYDVPGSGGTITRDGQAVTMLCPEHPWNTYGVFGNGLYPDPVLACFRLQYGSPAVTNTYDVNKGGNIGLYQESPFHSYVGFDDEEYGHVAGPLVMDVACRNPQTDTLLGDNTATKIRSGEIGTVNPDALTTPTARSTIRLATGDYVWNSGHSQSIRMTDLIEVTNSTTGDIIGVFRIQAFPAQDRIQLRTLSGATPLLGLSGASSPARFRWIQPTISIGGRFRDALAGAGYALPHFFVCAPALLTDNLSLASAKELQAAFLAADASPGTDFDAMGWGGFGLSNGLWNVGGRLKGDGGIQTLHGRQQFNLISRNHLDFSYVAGTHTHTWFPLLQGSQVTLTSDAAIGAATDLTFEINTLLYTPTEGDEFDLIFTIAPSDVGPITLTWPADFIFSGSDGIVPSSNPDVVANVIKYRFRYVARTAVTGWLAERTDY